MKKILIIIMAALLTLPLFGCSKQESKVEITKDIDVFKQGETEFEGLKEIAFTAEKPICVYDWDSAKQYKRLVSHDARYDFYKDYSAYYNDELKDKLDCSFYMVKTERRRDGEGTAFLLQYGLMSDYFYFYADSLTKGKYVNPCIHITIKLHEDEFEDLNDPVYDDSLPDSEKPFRNTSENITLMFTFAPVTNLEEDAKYRLEFGIDESKETDWYDKYFNLYKGETCIATCYYQLYFKTMTEHLTYEWFENYLKENLVLQA